MYNFSRNKHFVATKKFFCFVFFGRSKSMLIATKLLPRQIFVATNIIVLRKKFCPDKHTFVATKFLSRQK